MRKSHGYEKDCNASPNESLRNHVLFIILTQPCHVFSKFEGHLLRYPFTNVYLDTSRH